MATYNVNIFSKLNSDDDVGNLTYKISEGIFTNGVGELTSFYTSSTQFSSSGMYYLNIYQTGSSMSTSEVQFSISYGHISGSGSVVTDENKPSRSIYNQYRNLLLEPSDNYFTISGSNTNHFIAINFKRSRFKENIDPGNIQIKLTSTQSANTITLIDDSGQSLGYGGSPSSTASGKKYFNIVSGTIESGPSGSNAGQYAYYGLLYHEMGILILNANAINSGLKLDPTSGSFITQSNNLNPVPNNNERFYDLLKSGASMKVRSEETLNSKYVFVRVKSRDYNFSNNPTYISGSQGRIIDSITRRGVPFSYITGIGLYNDNNELLATAKLSKPLFKEPGTEALIKIRLDF